MSSAQSPPWKEILNNLISRKYFFYLCQAKLLGLHNISTGLCCAGNGSRLLKLDSKMLMHFQWVLVNNVNLDFLGENLRHCYLVVLFGFLLLKWIFSWDWAGAGPGFAFIGCTEESCTGSSPVSVLYKRMTAQIYLQKRDLLPGQFLMTW